MISLHTCNDKNDEKRTLTTCRSLFFHFFLHQRAKSQFLRVWKWGGLWIFDDEWVFFSLHCHTNFRTQTYDIGGYMWLYIPLIPILIPLEPRYVASITMGTWHTSLSHGSGSRRDPDPWWKNSLRPQLELWLVRGNYPKIAELFRSVNYDNLPICIYICSHI